MGGPRSRSPWQRARRHTTSARPLPSGMKPAAQNVNHEFDNQAPCDPQGTETMNPFTIGGINKLPEEEKRAIYARYIPRELTQKFSLPDLTHYKDLLQFRYAAGASDVEMRVYHQPGFQDPVLYAHLTDTLNGQIHVLLYILNDPESPRFDVDRMPDGSPTRFGTSSATSQPSRPPWTM